MHTRTRAATTSLPFLFAVGFAAQAFGQPAPTAPAQTPPPAPTFYMPGAPPAGAPSTQAPTAPPTPTTQAPATPPPLPATPGTPPPAATPEAPPPPPPQPFQASASWTLGGGASAEASGPGTQAAGPRTPEQERQWRIESLKLQNNLYGSTGLLRLSEAGSGAAGTFRLALLGEWFHTSDFLCTSERPCGAGRTGDTATHFGTTASLSITPLAFMEVFGSFRSYANTNSLGRPELLQTLGDTVLGLKGFTPTPIGKVFRVGAEAQLLLLNGTGDVGFNSSGTSFRLRGLATADLTDPKVSSLPLKIHTNIGYRFDNSGSLVENTEKARGNTPITRIERYGLGINRTDFVELGLGAEAAFEVIRPFVGYTLDIPSNRQDYVCNTGKATTVAYNDGCLGQEQKLSRYPSRLTLGARAFPKSVKGFAPMVALDIGVTGTSQFLEEIAPTPPWTLYFGVGYAADVVEPPPPAQPAPPPPVMQAPPPPMYAVRGVVHEQGKTDPVPNAEIFITGQPGGGYITSADGKFETRVLQPGSYAITIKAEGYKDGQCAALVQPPMPEPMQNGTAPGQGPAGATPQQAPGTGPMTPPPGAPSMTYINVDCPVEAAPRMGNLSGSLTSADNKPVGAGVTVILIDTDKKEHKVTTDATGSFKVADLKPGEVTLRVESDKYMMHMEKAQVRPREDTRVTMQLTPRGKAGLVTVTKSQIVIRQQVHFETDSDKIMGDSNALMEEIADVITRTPAIRKIEIQGHTDNTGAPEHNQELSEKRAQAVRAWLVAHGVEGSRLEAKGYGQSRPVVPNVTARNRARNRRVEFMIVDRGDAAAAPIK